MEKRKRVAIIGFASSSRDQAPYGDESFEVWSLNHAYTHVPRWDRWFEVHPKAHFQRDLLRDGMPQDGKRHVDWLRQEPAGGRQIYCQEHYDDIPASVRFPREEINAWLRRNGAHLLPPPQTELPDGFFVDDYYTSTPAEMLALAIYEGFEEIHLYGIDMLQAEEYCIGPEEKVLTADLRWVRAGDLKVNDLLIGFDEETPKDSALRRWQPSRVEVVQRLRLPSRRIHTADGKTILCSADHRWLVRSGNELIWRTTDELVYPGHRRYRGGRPSRLMKLMDTWTEDRSWDAGYMAAALDGEGNLCQTAHYENNGVNMKISFGQRDNAMARECVEALDRLGYEFTKSKSATDGCYNYNLKGGRTEALRLLGSVRPRRLLERFNPSALGFMKIHGVDDQAVAVEYVEDVGEQEVIGLRTSTKTFIAEGFASHNSYQRSGCEYYVGFARGRGIKVYIPQTSALCKANYVYGYSEPPTDIAHVQAYVEYLGTKIAESDMNKQKAANIAHTLDGGLQMARLMLELVNTGVVLRDAQGNPVKQEDKEFADRRDATMADVKAECEAQIKKLEAQSVQAQNTVIAMDGQLAGFRCSQSWIEHYARGGKLA